MATGSQEHKSDRLERAAPPIRRKTCALNFKAKTQRFSASAKAQAEKRIRTKMLIMSGF